MGLVIPGGRAIGCGALTLRFRDLGPGDDLYLGFSTYLPTVGFVEVRRDGKLVLERFAPESGTMYPNPRGEVGSVLKFGPYRESSIATPETSYFDNWRIGTSHKAGTR
jgi:hypothetical protein